jgi:hypothetical protein
MNRHLTFETTAMATDPTDEPTNHIAIRSHSAFLNSYAAEDEGLYDDYPRE